MASQVHFEMLPRVAIERPNKPSLDGDGLLFFDRDDDIQDEGESE
jgi:hypothetical protein